MGKQYINNVMNLKWVTLKKLGQRIYGSVILAVGFAGLIEFQPLIVLEMFDKEHASVGVGIVMGFIGLSAISGFRFSSK